MEVIKIDNRTKKVFVLDRSDDRIVYIPVKSCHRIDYDRLVKAEKEKPDNTPLLSYLRKIKFDNGRNALDVLDKIIQVANVSSSDSASRLPKPDEAESFNLSKEEGVAEKQESNNQQHQAVEVPQLNESKVNMDNPNEPVEGVEYKYQDRHGKTKIWGGKGRMPIAIKEALEEGKQLHQFAM